VRPASTDTDARSGSRRVLVGWALLFVLTSTLTAVTAVPLIEALLERPRRDQLLRAIQLVRRSRPRRGERNQVEDVFAAYARLARGRPASREALQKMLSDLVEAGLVSRQAESGYQLTPEGAALLQEAAED